jgi:hypothetical protein
MPNRHKPQAALIATWQAVRHNPVFGIAARMPHAAFAQHLRPPVPRLWRRTGTDPVSAWPRLCANDGTVYREQAKTARRGERSPRDFCREQQRLKGDWAWSFQVVGDSVLYHSLLGLASGENFSAHVPVIAIMGRPNRRHGRPSLYEWRVNSSGPNNRSQSTGWRPHRHLMWYSFASSNQRRRD